MSMAATAATVATSNFKFPSSILSKEMLGEKHRCELSTWFRTIRVVGGDAVDGTGNWRHLRSIARHDRFSSFFLSPRLSDAYVCRMEQNIGSPEAYLS